MHEHDPEQSHISIIARGSFKVFSGGSESTGTAGMVLDFPDNTPHEFIALEINSKLININKTVVR